MSLPNVQLPANTWVDLYAASNATVGNALVIQNLGEHKVRISYDVDQPTDLSSYFHAKADEFIGNEIGDGFWAYSYHANGLVAVQEA
jgi:hypothetical protein